jgi:hypothetical protein
MTAALYLVRHIRDANLRQEVRLFEGFVTYKSKKQSSDHAADVCMLREVVLDPDRFSHCIFNEYKLKMNPSAIMVNAFEVAGISTGVPLVIKRDA